MTFKDKLNNILEKKQRQFQNAKESSKQRIDEKNRKKIQRLQNAKPSWKTDIKIGLAIRDTPIGVAKKSWNRRRYERKTR